MAVEIVRDDVLHWAETYTGPQAHALLADAPYHLTDIGRSFQGQGGSVDPRTDKERSNQRRQSKGFMGSDWDGTDAIGQGIAFLPSTWAALAQHLLPGAFLMVFASTRGYHRLACALEDAGLIIHPCIVWVQSQGFPKATRIDTAIDKAAGIERAPLPDPEARRHNTVARPHWSSSDPEAPTLTAPATPLAQAWAGHRHGRQALKPSCELIAVAQKPYEGRAVDSIVKYGAGALNIDAGRVMTGDDTTTRHSSSSSYMTDTIGQVQPKQEPYTTGGASGRWPPNLALVHLDTCHPIGPRTVRTSSGPASGPTAHKIGGHGGIFVAPDGHRETVPYYAAPDGTETVQTWACDEGCPVHALDLQAGGEHRGGGKPGGESSTTQTIYGDFATRSAVRHEDTGPVSRFYPQHGWTAEVAERLAGVMPAYYCGKSSASERAAGLQGRNPHPTLKPLALCLWLCTLLSPPAAYAPRRLLVPFCGTGSEIIGGVFSHGFEEIIAIEREAEYVAIAQRRLAYWTGQQSMSPAPEAIHDAASVPGVAGEQLTLY